MYYCCWNRRGWGITTSICILTTLIFSVSSSRAYPNGCANQPPSYYNYDSYSLFSSTDLSVRSNDDFLILRRLGVGKFSDVFEAVDVALEKSFSSNTPSTPTFDGIDNPKALCVIKCLKPVSERKVKRELLVLSHTRNLPNMVRLLGVVLKDPSVLVHSSNEETSVLSTMKIHEMPSFVFNHAGQNSRWLCHGVGVDSSVVPSFGRSGINPAIPDDSQAPFHLTEYEIKYYLCHLLIALDALHSKGIFHRDIKVNFWDYALFDYIYTDLIPHLFLDVKPRNILINRTWSLQTPGIDRKTHRGLSNEGFLNYKPSHPQSLQGTPYGSSPPVLPLVLIDFGLADFYLPNKSYNVRVASRHYKAPELLLGFEYYDYGIDMWGVGCILAGLLFRREPFFRGRDNTDQLGKIVSVLGSIDLIKYCQKYGIKITPHVESIIATYDSKGEIKGKRISWLTFLTEQGHERNYDRKQLCPIPSIESIDLLDQLLVYDQDKRLTAREALMHPFFHQVRERAQSEVRMRQMSCTHNI